VKSEGKTDIGKGYRTPIAVHQLISQSPLQEKNWLHNLKEGNPSNHCIVDFGIFDTGIIDCGTFISRPAVRKFTHLS
jgi:hypothetical protein